VLSILGYFKILKELTRHLLRRPVVGIVAAAHTSDGRWLLIRRGDTGEWALPGGTLEWGETLHSAIVRELAEETGVDQVVLGDVVGVYSNLDRDPRFHAVTIVVNATIEAPTRGPCNPVEVPEVRMFSEADLPSQLSHGMTDMLRNAQKNVRFWE
jgi:8-oxo-dGTP diphosphatase